MSDEKPLELTIHFTATTQAEAAPLQVSASARDRGLSAGPIDFAIPLDDKGLADLRWDLEVYPQWPVGPDYDRALKIEADLRKWGKALFDAAFADREMLRVYDEFRHKDNVTHLITLDTTDPRVLQLPWELLADEGLSLHAAPADQHPPPLEEDQGCAGAGVHPADAHPVRGEPSLCSACAASRSPTPRASASWPRRIWNS